MCTIFVHPVNTRVEKEKEGRKHPRALSRINNKEVARNKNCIESEKEKKKKIVIIHPK